MSIFGYSRLLTSPAATAQFNAITALCVDPESRHAHHDEMTQSTIHVPDGFAVVTPYIFVDKGEDYIRFLEVAFGAREIGRSLAPSGRIANCQMKFDTTTIMVSEAVGEFSASAAAFYLYVADADAAMDKAIGAGAHKIMDTADMPYGDRQGGVRDPSGNIWWISQRLSAEPYL